MQESADWCGSAHGIRQPEVKWKLSRFRKCTDKNQYENRVIQRVLLYLIDMLGNSGERIRVADGFQQQNPDQKRQTARSGDQQGLSCIGPRRVRAVFETDQQI